jgi:hypothetical protein
MQRFVIPFLLSLGLAVTARTAAADDSPKTGTVGQLVLAWEVYAEGLRREEPVLVLTGIRLARAIGQRAATGWGGDPLDPPDGEPAPATGLPQDPASDAALALALIMAEGDPDLADLAEVIAGEVTQAPPADFVTSGKASVEAGKADSYQIAFNGQVPAEIAVIVEGASPVLLRIEGPDGQPLCQTTATSGPAYCSFTPAQNDYFTVTITNPGKDPQVYLLVTN